MNTAVEITRTFPSKRAALDFMQFIDTGKILLMKSSNGYCVVYPTTRSTLEGELIPKEDPVNLPTT